MTRQDQWTVLRSKLASAPRYGVDRVYNARQTTVSYEYLPMRTIEYRGANTVWIKCACGDKERHTPILLGDSLGNKYDLFLVLEQAKSTVAATMVENLASFNGFDVHVWMEVGPWHQKHDIKIFSYPTILLLWDDVSAHWTPKVQTCAKELNVKQVHLPSSYTWCCEPADVSWNSPLKKVLLKFWPVESHIFCWINYDQPSINNMRLDIFKKCFIG
ncbi:hypothetical protein ACHHYP_08551 [Achlya hypogyna]|uniref:DDE-1 domain-containing protein n=1 Tax=Achlya hypogyna TaxID=1202772 RepID=A0A1V9YP49_ACHHY|nr:hypothetical protein ACHHYP_08551 [Achlya hypogyna]